MMRRNNLSRRRFLRGAAGTAGAMILAGCDSLSRSEWFPKVLSAAEELNRSAHRLLGGRRSMAQEFTQADLSPDFRSNGTADPDSAQYQALADNGFADYRLQVDGLVDKPASFSLTELRAMPSRTQITRHDCVEGWSAIGKWKGVPLAHLLAQVKPLPSAKYVVCRCADSMDSGPSDSTYYESVDLDDAYHPQTILAYDLNDAALPMSNGAPLRARIERQLGYKHAKYVMRIELVDSF